MPLPSVTSGLQWWFDARDITGVGNGSTISSWNDSSGNGHTASVSTGSATYQTNQYNGGAALTLASCRMAISGSVASTGAHTMFAAFKLSTGNGGQTIVGNSAGGLNYRLIVTASSSLRLQFAFTPFATGLEGTGTAPPDTVWHQSNLVQDSSVSLSFRLDQASDPTILTGGLAAGTGAPIYIGDDNTGTYLTGQLQLVGLYNRALTLTEIQQVESSIGTVTPPPVTIRQPMIFVVT